MQHLKEKWVKVKNVGSKKCSYYVSNTGNVKSVRTLLNGGKKETLLIPTIKKNGFQHYTLSVGGELQIISRARLVADAFIKRPKNKFVKAFRLNPGIDDYSVSNLYWRVLRSDIDIKKIKGMYILESDTKNIIANSLVELLMKSGLDFETVLKILNKEMKIKGLTIKKVGN